MTWYNPRTWFEGSEPECDHPSPTFDFGEYWYEYMRQEGHEYWSEHDATFVKLRSIDRLLVCRYCGDTTHISSAEEVGGPEGLIRKQDVWDDIRERPDTNTGAWKNSTNWFRYNFDYLGTDDNMDEIIEDFLERSDQSE